MYNAITHYSSTSTVQTSLTAGDMCDVQSLYLKPSRNSSSQITPPLRPRPLPGTSTKTDMDLDGMQGQRPIAHLPTHQPGPVGLHSAGGQCDQIAVSFIPTDWLY